MASSFEPILKTLEKTVHSITGKVESGKINVSEYKNAIVSRIREIVAQLDQLVFDPPISPGHPRFVSAVVTASKAI